MNKISEDLKAVREILIATQVIASLRKEVQQVISKSIVIGSEQARNVKNASDYDFIILHDKGKAASEEISKRLKEKMPNLKISSIEDSVVKNIIGIKKENK